MPFSNAIEVGKQLVSLMRQNRWQDAVKSWYSADVLGIEAGAPQPEMRRKEGIAAVLANGEWFADNHDIHASEIRGPWPNDERFIIYFKLDVTAKSGPMAGKRFTIEEAGLYTVQNSKIVKVEFFYLGM